MGKKVTAIVVTYNRKELLADCLIAICAQEFKPVCVYVIDNASTDGTDEWIKENGYDGLKDSIDFRYVRLPENIGGAGGFHTGLKMAHEAEDKFDAFWLMDDDGVPDKAQLRNLLAYSDQYDYLAPLVVAKEDNTRCAFYDYSVEEFKAKAIDGLIPNEANPFNGVLYSRRLVDAIGYPIKEMFIWGDETNYNGRCIKAGYKPVIVLKAVHVHPKDRQIRPKLYKKHYAVPEQNWKLYVYVRNTIYNLKSFSIHTRHVAKMIYILMREYAYYYTFVEPSCQKKRIVLRALYDGVTGDFSRMNFYR